MTGQSVEGKTTISVEYPTTYINGKNLPYYPVINRDNMERFEIYKKLADHYCNLYVCGRLGDYKYYNMDAAIIRALEIEKRIEGALNGQKET